MADSPYIVDIDESNYDQIVIQGSHQVPVLIDFWASWCQPCQMLMPVLAKLVDEYQGKFILAKLNTEEQQAIAARFGIRSIPTVKLFRDGAPVDEFMGALPEAEIRAFLDRHLPRESDGVVTRAEQQLAAGDTEGAMVTLHQARDIDPGNPRVLIALAKAHAAGGDTEAAAQILDGLSPEEREEPEIRQLLGRLYFDRIALQAPQSDVLAQRIADNPADSEARYQLAAQQVGDGLVEDALETLLQLMQRDRQYGDDAARSALLRLFDMLGDDPAVTRYRARMFNLLH